MIADRIADRLLPSLKELHRESDTQKKTVVFLRYCGVLDGDLSVTACIVKRYGNAEGVTCRFFCLEPVRNSAFLQKARFRYLVWVQDSEISGAFVANEVYLRHWASFGAYHPR